MKIHVPDPTIREYLFLAGTNMRKWQDTDSLRAELLALLRDFFEETQSPTSSLATSFFRAERSFLEGEYPSALKLCLEMNRFPGSRFYSFRAAAHLFYMFRNFPKALSFAKHALTFENRDPFAWHIYFLAKAQLNELKTKNVLQEEKLARV